MLKNDLTNDERLVIYQPLPKKINGKLPHGFMSDTAKIHNKSWYTLSRIWNCGNEPATYIGVPGNLDSLKEICGRNWSEKAETRSKVTGVHISYRATVISMAEKWNIKMILHEAKQTGIIDKYMSSVKPLLSEKTSCNDQNLEWTV